MLLILTSDQDFTADYLIVELLTRQLPYFRLNAEDLSNANFDFSIDAGRTVRSVSVGSRTLNLDLVKAVWYRRTIHPTPKTGLTTAERYFVSGELRHLAMGLVLNPRIIWVNPIDKVSVAEIKLFQLQIAKNLGFNIPRTMVSSDLDKLKKFASENQRGTICKPIFHGLFFDGIARHSVYTRRLDIETFDSESVSICPVLLQEEVPRIADVRATFIGSRHFVADITGDASLVDWREQSVNVIQSVSQLDDMTVRLCRRMLSELGLLYGAFDFIRKPSGDLVFLEVNPTGEWAWLENTLGFQIRDAFIETFFGPQN